jgi:hypothetical protein
MVSNCTELVVLAHSRPGMGKYFEIVGPNQALLPDNFSTASRLQNCRKALR